MTNWIVSLFKAIGSILFILTILSAAFSGMAVGGALGAFGGASEAARKASMGFMVGGVVGLASATALYGLVFVAISTDAHAARLVELQSQGNELQRQAIRLLEQMRSERGAMGNRADSKDISATPIEMPVDQTAEERLDQQRAKLEAMGKKGPAELIAELKMLGYEIAVEGGTTKLTRNGMTRYARSKGDLLMVLATHS